MDTAPEGTSAVYADYCYQKLIDAHHKKEWDDCATWARAISTEFSNIAIAYQRQIPKE